MSKQPDADFLDNMADYTRHEVGVQIRKARQQMGMSQARLAEILSRRQAYISDLENGKAEPSASMLVQLAYVLRKPVSFFFPREYRNFEQDWATTKKELSVEEQELITKLRRISYIFDTKQAMYLVNALADYSERMFEAFESDIPSDEELERQQSLEDMEEMKAMRKEFEAWRASKRQQEQADNE